MQEHFVNAFPRHFSLVANQSRMISNQFAIAKLKLGKQSVDIHVSGRNTAVTCMNWEVALAEKRAAIC